MATPLMNHVHDATAAEVAFHLFYNPPQSGSTGTAFGSWIQQTGTSFVDLATSLTQAGITRLNAETTADLDNTQAGLQASSTANGQQRSAWATLVDGLTQLASTFENSTVGRESTLDTAMTTANNSYSTAATDKWSTFANSLAQAEKTYLNAVAAATGTNAATAITAAQKVRNDARSLALKNFQTGLLDSGVTLNSAITGAIQTFVTGQSAADAQESQGEATATKTHDQADTTAEIGLTSALVTAGNAAATALSGASGAFSLATSGAQSAWKIAAAVANGIYNPDGATRVFNDKLAEFFADQQATNNPLTAAAEFVSTMVTAVANAESAAATASGNALTTAVNTIGTADVTAVTATTNTDSAYSTASVGNDKTYLDGMATAEANYLKVVAGKWHEFRTGAITATQRDEAIATSWTEFQTAAAQKRNTFRIAQAEDAATFRNTVAGAAKTHIDAVTAAQETLTNSLQNGQKTLTQQKADAWLTASKGLVNLDTESTIQRAQGLAAAIGELAGEHPVYVDNGQSGYTFDNPFWVALAQKANQSAEYMADMKNAERLYYGRSPWSETVNGAVIDHMNGTRGVLDARRDFEVGMADAAATQNKALQQAGGTRDRELADAGLQLAQARSTYETDWANLNLESSDWKLDQPTLPINGTVDGTISLTAGVGTTFVPGWFSVPRLSEAGLSATTSTGFSSLDLDYFFTGGLMPDMPGSDPVTTGKVSRDDSAFASALVMPAVEDGNTTTSTQQNTDEYDASDPGYEPQDLWHTIPAAFGILSRFRAGIPPIVIAASALLLIEEKPSTPNQASSNDRPKFDPLVDQLPALPSPNMDELRDEYLTSFLLTYGKEGRILLDAYTKGQGEITVHWFISDGLWPWGGKSEGDFNLGSWGGRNAMQLNDDLTMAEAADEIWRQLVAASSTSVMRQYLTPNERQMMEDDTYIRLEEQSRKELQRAILELGKTGGEIGFGAEMSVATSALAVPGTIVGLILDMCVITPSEASEAYKNGGFKAAALSVVVAVVLNSIEFKGGFDE